jgi:hypothetical protein
LKQAGMAKACQPMLFQPDFEPNFQLNFQLNFPLAQRKKSALC